MFGWEYPPRHAGGLGVACQGIVHGLRHHNMRVTLALPFAHPTEHDVCCPTTASETIHIQTPLQPYDSERSYGYRWNMSTESDRELYGWNLTEEVERFTAESATMTAHVQPDIIHCHDWMTFGAGYSVAKQKDIPWVAHIHATELDRTHFQPNELIFALEKQGLERATHVIAVSEYTKGILVKWYGISEERITVIHNGLTDFSSSPSQKQQTRPPLVLFFGRMAVQKNPQQFLNIARHIHDLDNTVQFLMAGSGALLPEIMEQACAQGLAHCMTFAGQVQSEEVSDLYRLADCFVMPSVSEPFGLVALEAIDHGVPVVVSKQSGVAEVLNHAFKVDYWDTDKMADCILTILRESALQEQMRTESHRSLRGLTWKNQAKKIRDIYHKLCSFFSRHG